MGKAGRAWLAVAAAVWLLAACVGPGEKRFRDTVEGNFKILWDQGTGLSASVHLIEPLQAKFPEAAFDYTNIWRIFYAKPDLDIWPFHQYDVTRHNVSGDLIVFEHTLAPHYFASGYLAPLDEYVSADPSIHEWLDPAMLDRIRRQGDGQIYGLPFGKNVYALYYNKDIFDELQVPYPRDGMTWDEVLALAWQIKDHPFYGNRPSIALPDPHLVLSQLGLRIADPETGVPDFRDPLWTRYWAFLAEFGQVGTSAEEAYMDFTTGEIAMAAGRLFGTPHTSGIGSPQTHLLNPPFGEWDMVSFPVMADARGTGPAPAYYYIGIPGNSSRKHDAFRMISYLLSDEAQLALSRNGPASVRREPAFKERYGELTLRALGKNTPAFFHHQREAVLDSDYDLHMQNRNVFGDYKWYADRDRVEDFYNYSRELLLNIREYRDMWLEKTAPD